MAIEISWNGTKRVFEKGEVLKLSPQAYVEITKKGVIKLSGSYKSKKYLPRRYWRNPEVPELLSEEEWSKEVLLRDGILEFDILGNSLSFEVVDI
jgi:hypothetical protein